METIVTAVPANSQHAGSRPESLACAACLDDRAFARRGILLRKSFAVGSKKGLIVMQGCVRRFVVGLLIAMLWVVWTRLILEALVVHFKVEDNTRRTPLVDQTQPHLVR